MSFSDWASHAAVTVQRCLCALGHPPPELTEGALLLWMSANYPFERLTRKRSCEHVT
jgi:hypothetical protein